MYAILLEGLSCFALAALFSFVGSLQVGMVNMAVFVTRLHEGSGRAWMVAVGGVLPEIVYAGLAWQLVLWVGSGASQYSNIPWIAQLLTLTPAIVGLVLIALGVVFIQTRAEAQKQHNPQARVHPFFYGLTLAMINPQLLIFWSGIALGYQSTHRILQPQVALATFSFGAAVGAIALLALVINLAGQVGHLPARQIKRVQTVIGLALLVYGLWLLAKTIWLLL